MLHSQSDCCYITSSELLKSWTAAMQTKRVTGSVSDGGIQLLMEVVTNARGKRRVEGGASDGRQPCRQAETPGAVGGSFLQTAEDRNLFRAFWAPSCCLLVCSSCLLWCSPERRRCRRASVRPEEPPPRSNQMSDSPCKRPLHHQHLCLLCTV